MFPKIGWGGDGVSEELSDMFGDSMHPAIFSFLRSTRPRHLLVPTAAFSCGGAIPIPKMLARRGEPCQGPTHENK